MESLSAFRNIYDLSNVLQRGEQNVPCVWNVKSQTHRMPSSLTLTSEYFILCYDTIFLIHIWCKFRSRTICQIIC